MALLYGWSGTPSLSVRGAAETENADLVARLEHLSCRVFVVIVSASVLRPSKVSFSAIVLGELWVR